jgi:5-methylcytosine-specific restriction endonuclease McrA
MTLKAQIEYWKKRALAAEIIVAKLRSPKWPSVRKKHFRSEPSCMACGAASPVECHHIIPFHVDKNLELNPANLITLCETKGANCHLQVGHYGNWHDYNRHVKTEAAAALAKLKGNP